MSSIQCDMCGRAISNQDELWGELTETLHLVLNGEKSTTKKFCAECMSALGGSYIRVQKMRRKIEGGEVR